jgi:hypothetical protein
MIVVGGHSVKNMDVNGSRELRPYASAVVSVKPAKSQPLRRSMKFGFGGPGKNDDRSETLGADRRA